MIAQRAPAILFRPLDDPRANGIEVHIGQQIDQRIPVLHDERFETVPPEIPFAIVPFIIEASETLLDIFDELGKRRPPFPEIGNAFRAYGAPLGKPGFKPLLHDLIGKMIPGVHPDNQMKMIGHDAKPEHIGKIKPAQIADQVKKIVPFPISEWESIKGSAGNNMIHGGNIGTNKPGDTWHEIAPGFRCEIKS